MTTYSFNEVHCSFVGPGGSLDLGYGAGTAEEGITIEPNEAIDTLTVGADGTPMHSLHRNTSGSATVRLFKTSPRNQALAAMFALQTTGSATHGQNVFIVTNSWTNDNIVCSEVAFKRAHTLTYAKEAGINEWSFNCGRIMRTLGNPILTTPTIESN